jgi:predicted RNase H-like HicB family nuclease
MQTPSGLTRHFQVLIEYDPDEQVWVTYVPALDHLSTFGATRDEALDQTREAILGYLEAAAKEGLSVPAEAPPAELVDLEISVA